MATKYQHNPQYFDAPYTEDTAYIMGFIAGDGCVVDRKTSPYVVISLASRDHAFLVKLAQRLGTTAPVKQRSVVTETRGVAHTSTLAVHSPPLAIALTKMGITARKSKTYDPALVLRRLPIPLHRHFYRGLVDADGSLGVYRDGAHLRPRIMLAGTLAACEGFRDFLELKGVPCQSKIATYGTDTRGYVVNARNSVVRACAILYNDCDLFLGRKRDIAIRIQREFG